MWLSWLSGAIVTAILVIGRYIKKRHARMRRLPKWSVRRVPTIWMTVLIFLIMALIWIFRRIKRWYYGVGDGEEVVQVIFESETEEDPHSDSDTPEEDEQQPETEET
ncbi:uncharacterized protein LOC109599354 [Aethina tumida]|uniref:uncharacterized protein LOC109599354 n=1 Tax=Aethina tumida TaxID=116153 RepID=UPI00096AE06B|nr:uncharacterized protein LOC109599354 [Aethina tumida]